MLPSSLSTFTYFFFFGSNLLHVAVYLLLGTLQGLYCYIFKATWTPTNELSDFLHKNTTELHPRLPALVPQEESRDWFWESYPMPIKHFRNGIFTIDHLIDDLLQVFSPVLPQFTNWDLTHLIQASINLYYALISESLKIL